MAVSAYRGALFYVDALPDVGAIATVAGEEGFHAATVRRIRAGERLLLGDGAGELAWCEVEDAARGGVSLLSARVLERWSVAPPQPSVTVVQALPKSERSELAIELATEAGADGFVAWQADRCVARWDGPRAENGLRRWRAVARSAARQSRRAHIPAVEGPFTTAELAQRVAADVAAVLVLHEAATEPLIKHVVDQPGSIVIVVGPEGGISDSELAELTAAGARGVRLGPTVLRTSTAAAVALGALGVLTSRWDG
jgi:16S rRNA (uracil1498-N3)-methyltransferase